MKGKKNVACRGTRGRKSSLRRLGGVLAGAGGGVKRDQAGGGEAE